MVAEHKDYKKLIQHGCSLAKISMVAELIMPADSVKECCSLAKISMVAEPTRADVVAQNRCSLAKISMVAELLNPLTKV